MAWNVSHVLLFNNETSCKNSLVRMIVEPLDSNNKMANSLRCSWATWWAELLFTLLLILFTMRWCDQPFPVCMRAFPCREWHSQPCTLCGENGPLQPKGAVSPPSHIQASWQSLSLQLGYFSYNVYIVNLEIFI